MKTALTIAGSDSGGGAGIQADLKTFAARGLFGMSVITALTAQNSLGVQGLFEVPADFVGLQIDSVIRDFGADAIKTGMIANSAIIEMVAAKVREYRLGPLVVDPVMMAKSGDPLLRSEAKASLVTKLFPLATVVTPNIPEAELLCGFSIRALEEMRRAARAIHAMGPRAVVIKGGHLTEDATHGGAPASGQVVDLLFDGERFFELSGERIATRNNHGTGCTFASAIAAELAQGASLPDAVAAAKSYLTEVLRLSAKLTLGQGPAGPMDHMALRR